MVRTLLYERLGVKECFLFDPLDEYLQPRLQGFTLVQGHYQALPLSSEDELISRELGLILRPQGDWLKLVDSYTGQVLATAKIIELQQELERLRWKKN